MPDAPEQPLVTVAGPTGSGKSGLAIALAATFGGEIVNCDSLQVYRHFDIGAAKLPDAERQGIPHHLIDIVDPGEIFTAGEYARLAREAIAGISARGRLPIVAGGTGFYLRALLDGLFEGPSRDQPLRDRLAARESRAAPVRSTGSLPDSIPKPPLKIHPHDVPKVTRAVEVCLLSRRPVTDLYRQGRDGLRGYRALKLGLLPGREELNARVDARCRAMFEGGLVEEVRGILAMGFASVKPFESLGYKQALQSIRGELNPREALFYAQRNTRRYAKRQITWLRRETGIEWLRGFGESPEIRQAAIGRVRTFLSGAG